MTSNVSQQMIEGAAQGFVWSENIGKIMEMETPETAEAPVSEEPKSATENTIKFTNLQFGRNYDPTTDA